MGPSRVSRDIVDLRSVKRDFLFTEMLAIVINRGTEYRIKRGGISMKKVAPDRTPVKQDFRLPPVSIFRPGWKETNPQKTPAPFSMYLY